MSLRALSGKNMACLLHCCATQLRFSCCPHAHFGDLQGVGKAINAALLEAINSSGKAFLIHTEIDGKYMLRFALGSTNVQAEHVKAAWSLIASKAEEVVAKQKIMT